MIKLLTKFLTVVSNFKSFVFIAVMFVRALAFSDSDNYIITSESISAPSGTSECQNIEVKVAKDEGIFGSSKLSLQIRSDHKCIEIKNQKIASCPELRQLFKTLSWTPKRHHLKTKKDRIIGSFTEIDPSVPGIYFGVRHVTQQLSIQEAKEQLSQYHIYAIQPKSTSEEFYDILILVDKGSESSINDWSNNYLKSTPNYPSSTQWFSLQSGQDGHLSVSKQISCGQSIKLLSISGSQYEDFSLTSEGNSNFTSPASSGSLVWTYQTNQSGHDTIYSPELSGIINCQQKPIEENRDAHSNQLPTTHVLSFKRLFSDGSIRLISLKEAIDKKVPLEKFIDCDPISGRGAGAD